MGWKSVKEHYGIAHIVHLDERGLAIGSPYVPRMIVFSPEGKMVDRPYDYRSPEIERFVSEILSDPATFARLFAQEDAFGASIPVFSYDRITVVESLCEEVGFPNVTHAGELMYDNSHSADRAEAERWMRANAIARAERLREEVTDAERELAALRKHRDAAMDDLAAIGETVGKEA